MRRLLVATLVAILIAAGSWHGTAEAALLRNGYYVVRSVIGGSIVVLTSQTQVALYGAAAPGPNDPCYQESEDALLSLFNAFGSTVYLEGGPQDSDYRGRPSMYLWLYVNLVENWVLIDELIVRAGFAFAFNRPGQYTAQIQSAEISARNAKRGCLNTNPFAILFGDQIAVPARRLTVPVASQQTSAAPTGYDCPPGFPVKGNAQSAIYHMPGGQFYDVTRPEICFATETAAQAAGYRRSLR